MRLQQDNYTNTSVRVRWWKKPLSAKALMQIFLVCVCCGLFALTSGRALDAVRASSNVVGAQDWNQYLHDPQNTAASNETILSTANVSQLTRLWTFKTGAGIAAGAAVVGNTVYVGSWDGYEYALDLATGAQKWKTFLGQSVNKECQPSTIGVTSSALVDNGTIYVGGGDNYWYALDAATGNVLWKVDTGDNSAAGGHYNWSSPLIANGFAYIGIASNCDLPLVQGQLWKVDLSSHQVVGKTSFVPDGQVGGGVWTRPAIDSATNTIYVTTGTQSLFTQTLPQAIVSVDAATMAIKDSWQIPLQESNIDADFGNSPILFTDARGRQLVAATNKNGYTYAWDRAHLSAGPVWQQATNIGGECPVCGDGSVSSGAYADGRLFLAGGNAVINGVGFAGVVRALDPTTGAYLWEHALPNPVIPAIVYDNGLLIDASGPTIEVLDAATGHRLYSYQTGFTSYGPPAVANGTIIEGSGDGVIYALALSTKTVTPPADPNCPSSWTCQDIGTPAPVGTEQVASGVWNVTAGGSGLGDKSDQVRIATQPASGDTQVSAQIMKQPATNASSQAGLIVRQNNDPTSPYYAVFVTPNNGLTVQYRTAFGGATTVAKQLTTATLPLFLEIQRRGDTFQAATSTDGTNYTLVPGSTLTALFPFQILAGLVVSSTQSGTAGAATYANVASGTPNNTPVPAPSPTPCPNGWNCGDIGNPVQVGDQALASGVWTVKGSGQDINGHADQFHYVWQTLAGDATVSLHVTAQTNTASLAKTGLMIRQSADANATFYGAFITPGGGLQIIYRDGAGINSAVQTTIPATVPTYIQVTRWKNILSTYTSTDGTNWTYADGSSVTLSSLSGTVLGGIAVTSANPGQLSVATIDSVAYANAAAVPPSLCPDGWTCADVGFPTVGGSQTLINGTWKIRAGGKDIWYSSDQFRYMWQSQTGDGSVSARVVSLTNTDPWAKVGVMMRQTADADAPYYATFVTPSNGVVVQYRTSRGANTAQIMVPVSAPIYLKVARAGNTFTAYTSTDSLNWTAVSGSSVTLNLPATILTGLAATSHNASVATTVTIDNVTLTNSTSNVPTACPDQWSCEDIGAPVLKGGQTLNNGTWTLYSGDSDIWGTYDKFHYVQQTLAADGSVSAHVVSQSNTDPWAKAGVMLRTTTDAGSPYYGVFVTPGRGIAIQYRAEQGNISQQLVISGTVPAYLKITRSGTLFSTYTSSDGVNWSYVSGSTITLNMSGSILAGLAVTSHNSSSVGSATIDTVALATSAPQPPIACPTGWNCADVGNPPFVGEQQLANGAWTIEAEGQDIWDKADQFHLVSQTLHGDGSVSAHVVSQSNTDPWAKAGVMLRATTDAGSPYYGVFVTPGNGIVVQYRAAQGILAAQAASLAGATPSYLKVTRTGTTFSAFTSTNGTTWTPVPGSTVTVNIAGDALAGLAVTSHNGTASGTATFDTVTIG